MSIVGSGLRDRLAHLRAGTRLAWSLAVSVLILMLLPARFAMEIRAVAAWDGFAGTALLFTWYTILTLRPAQIHASAKREDPSRAASLVLVLMGAGASLLAVLLLLKASAGAVGGARTQAILLSLSAVALAWTLIHTVFTLRYAHLYHDASPTALAENGPLDFPGTEGLPDYLDFAYFAFVVGMTAQTSDVAIRGRRIRRTALMHGVIAWVFNTSVVALLISVLGSVVGG
ncbi:DUF1345 domain-containing protein [Gemmatimonas sp.]|uniref:DUF1345 domain-containing protein n=1 Tax=Gemmatimonas sp. TaxID=1962908 RepID=UPI00286E0485|nr:DUF1345 domain-containing protein [Gemmatimonas sp.]